MLFIVFGEEFLTPVGGVQVYDRLPCEQELFTRPHVSERLVEDLVEETNELWLEQRENDKRNNSSLNEDI